MRVGFVGMGKLGLPVALAAESAGHSIYGVESSPERAKAIEARRVPEAAHERLLGELLIDSELQLVDVPTLVRTEPELIFVCVQTPHEPAFEGNVPLTRQPQDFDYTALKQALRELHRAKPHCPVVVVSTCLPGTVERISAPLNLNIVYNPLFIAMGSVVADYENPEFVLVGYDHGEPPEALRAYYAQITNAPLVTMPIRSAELAKVAYNVAIGFKLLLANTLGEVCERVGANVDDVMGMLKRADKRIVSTAYMDAGMGDSGPCHPRDQIALSALANRVGLSYDPFIAVIQAREAHAAWLANLWVDAAGELPLVMLGEAYKANTTITTGSAATLTAGYARARREVLVLDDEPQLLGGSGVKWGSGPAAFFVAVPHRWITHFIPPEGSVVVDPWGVFPEHEGVRRVRPGRCSDLHNGSRQAEGSTASRLVA